MQLFNSKNVAKYFPLTQSKSGPDSKFFKKYTVRIQSKNFVIVRIGSSKFQCSSLQ